MLNLICYHVSILESVRNDAHFITLNYLQHIEATVYRCSMKNFFCKTLPNSKESTCKKTFGIDVFLRIFQSTSKQFLWRNPPGCCFETVLGKICREKYSTEKYFLQNCNLENLLAQIVPYGA